MQSNENEQAAFDDFQAYLSPGSLAPSLTVQRLGGPAEFASLSLEWEQLDSTLTPRTPFTSPQWNLLWWQHFRQQRLALNDKFFVHIVRDETGRLVAVAPMMVTHRPGRGPLRSRTLQFFGTDTNMTEVRGLVCRSSDQGAVVAALAKHFLDRPAEWDWIEWTGLNDAENWTRDLPGAQLRDRSPLLYLPLPDNWDEFRGRLSRNVKESLRKCYNSLKRDGHTFDLRVVSGGAELESALDRFFGLHGARADADMKVSHLNVFESEASQRFLRDYCHSMARHDQLRIFQLVIGGSVVATRIGFLLGSELYLYYSGYDPEWARYSVMTTTVAEALKWAIESGLSIANLSTGKDVSKTRWGPVELALQDATQVNQNWRSIAVYNVLDPVLRQRTAQSAPARLLAFMRRSA